MRRPEDDVRSDVTAERARVGPRGRWRAGSLLLARGEFSIVIAGLASVADADPKLPTVTATYVLLLAVAGPIATRIVHRVQQPPGSEQTASRA